MTLPTYYGKEEGHKSLIDETCVIEKTFLYAHMQSQRSSVNILVFNIHFKLLISTQDQ
jgi:hypothetical protein